MKYCMELANLVGTACDEANLTAVDEVRKNTLTLVAAV